MTSKPWWLSDPHDDESEFGYGGTEPVPKEFVELAGPKDLALVKVWPDGRTDVGWGLQPPKSGGDGFMLRYMRGEFNARRVLYGYNKDKWAFAFVMRSVQVVCIDIDGKNGGFEHAKQLGKLPHTMAETSKSGNGYHLFYKLEEDWDPVKGFGSINDRIGIETGVDVRTTGCVYHHSTQRWNGFAPAPLPDFLHELLLKKEQQRDSTNDRIKKVLANNDDLEVMMMQDEILTALAKPVPQGKRNVTMFALGNQMRAADIEDWDEKLRTRCDEIGLPTDETDKLIENIERYGTNEQAEADGAQLLVP